MNRDNFIKVVAFTAFFAFAAVFSTSFALAKDGEDNSGSSGSGSVKEIEVEDSSLDDDFEKNLSFGMTGSEEVARLQKKLQKEGLFDGPVSGNFLGVTKNAVIEFQKKNNIPATGFMGPLTRDALNSQDMVEQKTENGLVNVDLEKRIQDLLKQVNDLQKALQGQNIAQEPKLRDATIEEQAKAGVVITGSISGPGYPTGPLNILLPAAQLLFDKPGAGTKPGEVKGRQYEVPLETIPPTLASVPVTINGVANNATEVKVISNLKTKNGVGQHQGTIDIDIDTIPGGHVTLAYSGRATITGLTIASQGTFKTTKTTGIFAGLIAEGTYDMTIIEASTVVGSPVTVTLTTVTP